MNTLLAFSRRAPLSLALAASALLFCAACTGGRKPYKLPEVKTVKAQGADFVASKSGKVYHKRHCEYAHKMPSPVGYTSCDDAERSGKVPCQFCRPREGDSHEDPTLPHGINR